MDKYTASNGMQIAADGHPFALINRNGITTQTLSADDADALREFFRAEEDERLGRFRHGEFLVYPDGEDALGNRHVVTSWEKNGRRDSVYEDNVPNTPYGAAARAYFEAHPEPKPWHDAKPGEVWEISRDGIGVGLYLRGRHEWRSIWPSTGSTSPASSLDRVTSARRIWPEGDPS